MIHEHKNDYKVATMLSQEQLNLIGILNALGDVLTGKMSRFDMKIDEVNRVIEYIRDSKRIRENI